MYYKELLRVRSLLIKFAIVVACIALFVFLLSGHGSVSVNLLPEAGHHAIVASASSGDTNIYAPGIEVHGANHGVPFEALPALAAFGAAIFAMILGCCLAYENCGHLEIAWTRPASRIGYATRIMLVDAAGILLAFAFTLLVCAAFVSAKGWWHYFYSGQGLAWTIPGFVVYPFAWYGLIAAVTASVRGGAGLLVGLTWIVASVLVVLRTLKLPPTIHAVVGVVNYFNPMAYGSVSESASHSATAAQNVFMASSGMALAGLAGIAILGVLAALVQWRRLEA